MIVVCPECDAKYNVKAEVISADGRVLKCHHCGHSWFHKGVGFQDMLDDEAPASLDSIPEPDEGDDFDDRLSQIEGILEEELAGEGQEEEISIDFTDRAEDQIDFSDVEREIEALDEQEFDKSRTGDKETKKEKNVSEKPLKAKVKKKESVGAVIAGVFSGLVLFVFVFIGLLVFRGLVSERIPAFKPFYATMGFSIPVAGEGLVFDQISTEWLNGKLSVQGKIINLLTDSSPIPKVEVLFLAENGDVLDRGRIMIEDQSIEGEDYLPFSHDFQAMRDVELNTRSVKLVFLPID